MITIIIMTTTIMTTTIMMITIMITMITIMITIMLTIMITIMITIIIIINCNNNNDNNSIDNECLYLINKDIFRQQCLLSLIYSCIAECMSMLRIQGMIFHILINYIKVGSRRPVMG